MEISWDIEDDDNNFEPVIYNTGPSGLIFLIDASPPMFEKLQSNKRPFVLALQACKDILISLIKKPTNKNVQIGIVFYGTENTNNTLQLNNVTVHKSLSPIDADTIRNIMDLINEKDCELTDYNCSPVCPLKNGITVVQKMFLSSTSKFYSKRVALMTATSNPNEPLFDCNLKAKDLLETNIRLDLFPFGSNFDNKLFYQELLQEASGIVGIELPQPILNLEQLLNLCTNLDFHPRIQNKIQLYFSEQFNVSVSIFACSFEENWSIKPVKLDRISNDLLKPHVTYLDKETGRPLESKQIKYKYNYNKQTLIFTQEERQQIRSLQSSGIRIIQFFKNFQFKWDYHHRPCHFLTCLEGNPESEEIMDSLLSECMKKKVNIHCWMTNRKGSKSLQVILEPYTPPSNPNGINMISCPGFLIYFLPFKQLYLDESFRIDKYKDLNVEQWGPSQSMEENLKNAISKVVNESEMQLIPPPDPYEETFMANLEALALGYPDAKPVEDCTVPRWPDDYNLEENSKEIYGLIYKPEAESKKSTKRATNSDIDCPSSKKLCSTKTEDEIKFIVQKGHLNIYSVNELKEFAKTIGLKHLSKYKKNDFIIRITNHFN